MAGQDSNRNFYEESPDECKELLEKVENEMEDLSSQSREDLLVEHERHLHFLKSGPLPPRTFVLPLPYPPSPISVANASWTHMKNISIGSRKQEEFMFVRSIVDPYVFSSSVTIVEDENGHVARLTVCNVEDLWIDPVIEKGAIMAIKQPCWSSVSHGGHHIRVDHPSDLLLLKPDNDIIPPAWKSKELFDSIRSAEQWKTEGNMSFLKKRFRKALSWSVYQLHYVASELTIQATSEVCQSSVWRTQVQLD